MSHPLITTIAVCGAAVVSGANASQESISIPVPFSTEVQPEQAVRLQAFLYRPSIAGRYPVVIFNHGSAGGDPKASVPSKKQAQYFVSRGFIVVVPMRRGRGTSSGVSPESEDKNCDTSSWEPGLRTSFEDVSAVFKYVDGLQGADASKVILAGVSRGGFLSVAYAASGDRRSAIVGVINFVGGWVAQAEDNCPVDFNYTSFQTFGAKTKVPMLWLYGENDAFYSKASIQSYATAFKTRGGNVHFELVEGVPENGHWLPGYPALWSKSVDNYLSTIGFRNAVP